MSVKDYYQYLKGRQKWAAIGFVLFFVLHLLVVVRKSDFTPWLNYGMYSQKEYKHERYTGLKITLDGQPFNYMDLPDAQKEVVVTRLWRYVGMFEMGGEDPKKVAIAKRLGLLARNPDFLGLPEKLAAKTDEYQRFPKWLGSYLECISEKEFSEYTVHLNTYRYNKGQLEELQSTPLIQYATAD